MKTLLFAFSWLFLLHAGAVAQLDGSPSSSSLPPDPDLVQQTGPPGNSAYTITEAGPHHRRWAKLGQARMADGSFQTITNSFIELATGMNVWSATANGWIPASDEIELLNGAAVARHSQHQVIFSANLNDPNGTVDLLTPTSQRIRCRLVGLAYTEETQSVFVAEARDCQGAVVGANRVVYTGALDSIRADVCYTTTRAMFEADVILREQLPDPAAYGLKAETTRLEVWTEFLEGPDPVRLPQLIRESKNEEHPDEALEFGRFRMVLGRAYLLGNKSPENASHLPVAKEWLQLDGRRFLVESVSYARVEPMTKDLARHRLHPARARLGKTAPVLLARRGQRSLPRRLEPKAGPVAPKSLFLAKAGSYPQRGLVMDFQLINGTYTNFTFRADETYYVSDMVNLMQQTVLEGGVVIKTTNYVAGSNAPGLLVFGPFSCNTSAYRPAHFVAKDDDTLGESISGSTGTPIGSYGLRCLQFWNNGSSNQVHDLCLRNGACGVSFVQGSGHELRDIQLVNCYVGIEPNYCTLAVRNALITTSGYSAFDSYSSTVSGEHLTVHACNNVAGNTSSTLALTNCLLVANTNLGVFTSYSNAITNATSGVFQSIGAGNFYLVAGSPYRNLGTTNIHPALLTELKKTTT